MLLTDGTIRTVSSATNPFTSKDTKFANTAAKKNTFGSNVEAGWRGGLRLPCRTNLDNA
jgi:hypothetical protein